MLVCVYVRVSPVFVYVAAVRRAAAGEEQLAGDSGEICDLICSPRASLHNGLPPSSLISETF